jgi:hypothetical protein
VFSAQPHKMACHELYLCMICSFSGLDKSMC